MTSEESALLAAIAAAPTDQLLRGVYADWLDDEGRHDEADAVRATADRVPLKKQVWKEIDFPYWIWSYGHSAAGKPHCVTKEVSEQLCEKKAGFWFVDWEYQSITAALLDLIRAWCAVHRSEVLTRVKNKSG